MINKELIYDKLDELMQLTVDCEFLKEDYLDLYEIIGKRIKAFDQLAYHKLIAKLCKEIKQVNPDIDFIPTKVVKIKGFKIIEDSIKNAWHTENLKNNEYIKKLLENEQIDSLYNSLLKASDDSNDWVGHNENIMFWKPFDNNKKKDGKFLCGISFNPNVKSDTNEDFIKSFCDDIELK